MLDESAGHGHVVVFQDHAGFAQFVRTDQGHEGWPAFVRDAGIDVVGVHFEEQPGHAVERGRAPGIDVVLQAGGPGEKQQVAVIGIVVGVLVGEEDVTDGGEGQAGLRVLAGDAVAAIDDIGDVVDEDDLRGGGAGGSRARSAGGAEEDEAGFGWRGLGWCGMDKERQRSGNGSRKFPPGESGHVQFRAAPWRRTARR